MNKELGTDKKVRWYHVYKHFTTFGYSALDKLAAWLEKSAQIMQLDYSAEKPGIIISRYEIGADSRLAATS